MTYCGYSLGIIRSSEIHVIRGVSPGNDLLAPTAHSRHGGDLGLAVKVIHHRSAWDVARDVVGCGALGGCCRLLLVGPLWGRWTHSARSSGGRRHVSRLAVRPALSRQQTSLLTLLHHVCRKKQKFSYFFFLIIIKIAKKLQQGQQNKTHYKAPI